MHKFKLDDFENKYKKHKKTELTVNNFIIIYKINLTFQSEERLINLHLVRRRERFGGLVLFLVYD